MDFTTPATIADHTQPDFLDQSQLLIKRLRTLSPLEIEKLMGVSSALAVLNASRYSAVMTLTYLSVASRHTTSATGIMRTVLPTPARMTLMRSPSPTGASEIDCT